MSDYKVTPQEAEGMRLGSELDPQDRDYVLRAYIHRFTRTHRPDWTKHPRSNGEPYPLQFDSDDDWLSNTWFHVKRNGRLDQRYEACESYPTWPDNPELQGRRGKRSYTGMKKGVES